MTASSDQDNRMAAQILRAGRPAQVEDYAELSGAFAVGARKPGLLRMTGGPIVGERVGGDGNFV